MRMLGATVPGRSCPPSMPGMAMWADMIAATPAAMALRNGTSSTESSRAQSAVLTGSAMWESVPVSPWPGKCLAAGQHPVLLHAPDLRGDQPAHGLPGPPRRNGR